MVLPNHLNWITVEPFVSGLLGTKRRLNKPTFVKSILHLRMFWVFTYIFNNKRHNKNI